MEGLSYYVGEDLPFIYEKIELAVDKVFSLADLNKEEINVLHDCVIPLLLDVMDDGGGNIRSAEILTRIYSSTRPSAVDVYLEYWYRTRWESVEYFCNVWYRAHANVSDSLKQTIPRSRSETKLNGFKRMMQMGLKDMPPGRRWRAIEERSFDIKEADVSALHRILFGEQAAVNDESGCEKEKLSKRIDKANMIELMLAGVGVSFKVAKEAEENDKFKMGEMTWKGLRGVTNGLGGISGDDKHSEDEEDDDGEDEDDDDDSEWEDEF